MTKISFTNKLGNMNETVEVLGCKLKMSQSDSDAIQAQEVIELINREVSEIKSRQPQLSDKHAAVMVALKLATDKLVLEQEYKGNLADLEGAIRATIDVIEEAGPTLN